VNVMNMRKSDDVYDEYFLLKQKLEELEDAEQGYCTDVDCDKYTYKDVLRKGYRFTLEYNFSCIKKVKRYKSAVMRLLSLKKFRKFRFEKCPVCKKQCDTLSEKSTIVSFTRPSNYPAGSVEWTGIWAHNVCKKKVKTPEGWKNSFY